MVNDISLFSSPHCHSRIEFTRRDTRSRSMKRCPTASRKTSWLIRLSVVAALIGAAFALPPAIAGLGGLGGSAVGGVMINASGLVRAATLDERAEMLRDLRNNVAEPQGDMADATEMRMVSLRKLQSAIQESLRSGKGLPAEVQMLAGLQRIEYVFVYPEQNDIVLAGPAEAWVVREDASVVGKTTGRPVLLLSDLVTAFRSVEASRNGGISVSIEPTAEGRQKLNRLLSRVRLQAGQDPRNLEPTLREAFGPQTVKLSNISETSHFARVLLAADYQMKRLAMSLDQSPVEGLPSYLEMARNEKHAGNENPRWWMACNYDALKHDADKLAWRLSGQGVKTLTEQDAFTNEGNAVQTGRQGDTAKKWADLMTERFDALAEKTSVFGDLRNLMDLSVVATLVVQEGLDQTAGCDLGVLMGSAEEIPLVSYDVPKAVSPECSFIHGRSGWTVTASGGVDINPFAVIEKQELDPSLVNLRETAGEDKGIRWWWNG